MTHPFDPIELLSTLDRHAVRFIIIEGFAGTILGSPTVTNDLGSCSRRSTI